MIQDIINTIAIGGAVILGATYLLGGLIVNLSLAKRGVTEYQILKVKYLVVGLIFLLHGAGVVVLSVIIAFLLLSIEGTQISQQLVNLVSMAASILLLIIWGKPPQKRFLFITSWRFWVLAGAVGLVFPSMILIRQVFAPTWDVYSILLVVQGIMAAVLALLALIYHYSSFYYGTYSTLGAMDPIGVGIPIPVKMAGEPGDMKLLKGLGVPIDKGGVTGTLYLLDETDEDYIVAFENEEGVEKAVKIGKGMVKAILYKPEAEDNAN